MPGRLFLTRSKEAFTAATDLPMPDGYQPRHNIAHQQSLMVWRDGQAKLEEMRWGISPVGRVNARGRPVVETLVNIRSETFAEKSAFEGMKRAVVPVDGWYEWTGEKRNKSAWRIQRKDGALLWFAALCDCWTAPGGQALWQVATLTTEPNADVAPIHHRMGALLTPDECRQWLTADLAEAQALLRPLPTGLLSIEQATGVDWSGP